MKAMISLWRNECVKITRQTASKVIIIIVLVFAILLSVIVSLTNDAVYSFDNEEYWRLQAETSLEMGDYLYYAQASSGELTERFFRENSIARDGWKYSMYFGDYMQLHARRILVELYLDGKLKKEEIAEDFYYRFGVTDDDQMFEDEKYSSDDPVIYTDDVDPVKWFESIDVKADLAQTQDNIKQLETTIINAGIKDYIGEELRNLRSQLKTEKAELAEQKARLEKGTGEQYKVDSAAMAVEVTEHMISFGESILNASISPEDEDWMLTAASDIGQTACEELLETVPMSEESFKSDPVNAMRYEVSDYKQYLEMLEKQRTNAYGAIMTVDYALNHVIPIPEVAGDSTKLVIRRVLGLQASLVILAMVILTAFCIANEYSSGTIRLLVIRPRSRNKILLSKFFALLTVGTVLCAISFILVNVVCVIVNGVGDLFVRDLMCSGEVFEVSSMVYSLGKMLLPVVSGLILVALAFMMAVLTRRAALAIVIPLVLNLFSSVAMFYSIYKSVAFPFLRYTIFPYLDLSPYLSSPVAAYGGFIDQYGSVISNANVSVTVGVAVIALHLAVLFAVGFIVFRRSQIKN